MPHGFYAIPGQHDLPLHNYDDLEKSAYWTLMEAGTLTNLNPLELEVMGGNLVISAFPWSVPPKSYDDDIRKTQGQVHLAVIHKFIWTRGTGYEGAPLDAQTSGYAKSLCGYTAAVFGDNHCGFLFNQKNPCPILNCGTFIRRRANEYNYEPAVGILASDGSIVRHRLDISADKWNYQSLADGGKETAETIDMSGLMADLSDMADAGINFHEAVNHYLEKNKVDYAIRHHVLKALEVK